MSATRATSSSSTTTPRAATMNAGSHPETHRVVYLTIKIGDQQHSAANTTARGYNNDHGCYIPARSFSVLGYEWQIDYHPNGHHPDGRHDHQRWVILRLTLVRGPSAAVTASFTFRVVDPSRKPEESLPEVTVRTTFRRGIPAEVPLGPRAAPGYLGRRDRNCFVQCKVALLHEPDTSAAHPTRGLGQDLGNLLSSQNGSDVTFVVGSGAESFRAHRCVLAARSPVFAAELAGSLMDETHKVKDMDPDAFRALLHFIYTDTLPAQLSRRPESGKQHDQEAASMARRLLAAADRYGVERLKMICEEKVCAGVDVDNVAADLVLAERRGYQKLRSACMEFLVADPANLLAVAAGGGCKLLETSCPSVLTEIVTAVSLLLLRGQGGTSS